MANAYIQPSVVAAEALSVLGDELVIGNLIYRDKTADFGTNNGYAVGDTINIKQRPDYEVKEFTAGGAITIQDVRESKRSLQVEKHFDVSMEIGAKELALDFDSFTEQVIKPAAVRLSEKIDVYLGTKIAECAGLFVSDTLLATAADVALAREAATRQRIPGPGRFALLGLTEEAELLGQTWFNQSDSRGAAGEATMNAGMMGHVMGMDWFASINFPETAQTMGTGTSTTDNTAGTFNAVGTSVFHYDSLTGQIEIGDRLYVAGNPTPLVAAAQAVATSVSVALRDPITEIITDGATFTTEGSGQTTTHRGVITEGNAFAMALPPLDAPPGADSSIATGDGISIRVVSDYDISAKKQIMSLDLLVGATCWDPRMAMLLAEY